MKQRTRWVWVVGGWVLAFAGCGGGKSESVDAAQAQCGQGGYYTCVGPAGCTGTQMCVSGKLTACDCSQSSGTQPAGSGTSGVSGSTGDGGSPDAGGTSSNPSSGDAGSGVPVDGGGAQPPPQDAGSNVPSEDCSNGVDDDGDGKIDCLDEDCGAWTCAASAPSGWSGPIVLYEGAKKAPSCEGSYTEIAMHGGTAASADDAQCTTCTCSGSGACASNLTFAAGSQTDCSGTTCDAMLNTGCTELSSTCLSAATAYVQTRVSGGGDCSPSAQSPSIADATWAKNVLACAPGSAPRRGGCGPGNVCAPPTPFAGPFCILKQGDQACPSGAYTDRRVYYTAIDDTRDCTACSCGQDCAYSWQVFDDGDTACATPLATKTSAGECVTVTPSSGKIRVGATISGAGGCTPSGGAATGSVSASDPYTACCLP
ncbi:MAG: hypothetical protein ACHQ53_19205 [Polyangiales bacterium]